MNKKALFGLACLALIGALAFIGCDSGGGGTDPSPSAAHIAGTWKLTATEPTAQFAEQELSITAQGFSFEGRINAAGIELDTPPAPSTDSPLETAIRGIVSQIPIVIVNGTFKDMGNDIYKANVTSGALFDLEGSKDEPGFIAAYGAYLASLGSPTTLPQPDPDDYYDAFDKDTLTAYSDKTAVFALSDGNQTLTITSPDNLPVIPGIYTKQP
ncbi:MAG: hypothetical protein LBF78_13870 [Treponema sp.]|jgi:hypothetical protein|nr:hypothetical protein [Treponema sp.]